jgi:hypothetical protein
MTPRTNARIAGITFLLYIATGIAGLILFNQASHGDTAAARLASLAQHATLVRVTALLLWLQFLYAIVLGVTLYALTRDADRDLSLVATGCRFTEGVIAAMAAGSRLKLLSVATAVAGAPAPDAAASHVLADYLMSGSGTVAALCFAIASLIYSWLFWRARSIPAWLAGFGVLASVLWVVGLPAQMLGWFTGSATYAMWIPMALFEIALAVWLIFKGVAVRTGADRAGDQVKGAVA